MIAVPAILAGLAVIGALVIGWSQRHRVRRITLPWLDIDLGDEKRPDPRR